MQTVCRLIISVLRSSGNGLGIVVLSNVRDSYASWCSTCGTSGSQLIGMNVYRLVWLVYQVFIYVLGRLPLA